jgi:hypothetical protein
MKWVTLQTRFYKSFYHKGGHSSMKTATTDKKTGKFTRRIGSTTYRVGVHYSSSSRETMDEKITRLIQNETANGRGKQK